MRVVLVTYLTLLFSFSGLFAQTQADSLSKVTASSDSLVKKTREDSLKKKPPVITSSSLNSSSSNIIVNGVIGTSFILNDINLNKVDFISNVLKVYNPGTKPVAFYIEMALPASWQLVTKNDRYYTVDPKDTLYIPLRIMPRDFKKTSVNYTLTAIILSEDGYQIGDASFLAHTTKISKWELSILPRDKIYFLNNTNSVPFSTYIYNNGNTNQSILFYFREIGRKAMILDEKEHVFNAKKRELKLFPGDDTTMNFTFNSIEEKRNQRRLDIENHIPNLNTIEKRYSLIAFTKDADVNSKSGFVKSKRISFVKLPNTAKMGQFGYANLPVIMDANLFNIGGYQPILNLVLRGNANLANGGNLTYFVQNNFTSYFGTSVFRQSAVTIGYSKNRISVNIGNVGGGGVGGANFGVSGGKGINASYIINNHHRVGAFYARLPKVFIGPPSSESFGAFHYMTYNKFRLSSSIGHQSNKIRDFNALTFSTRVNYNLLKNHSVSATFSGRYIYAAPAGLLLNNFDYAVGLRYSGTFIKKIREAVSVNYYNAQSQYPLSERINIINRTQLAFFKKLPINISNSYLQRLQETRSTYGFFASTYSRTIGNNIGTGISLRKGGTLSPSVFYNFIELQTSYGQNARKSVWGHSRGLGLSYNFYNPETNLRFTYFIRAGYNILPDKKFFNGKNYPNTFFFQTAAMTQYKTFSFNVRYYYGTGALDTINTFYTSRYPQTIGINSSYQYTFKDQRFVFIPFVNYSYVNIRNRHSISVFPDFYYYSYSGWRFRFSFGGNVSFTENVNYAELVPNAQEEEKKFRRSSGFNFTLGVRKAFGIPIPKRFTKQHFATIDFIAFYDLNGNKIYDNNELLIENVVIGMNEIQVLTNVDGKAVIENIPSAKYKFTVFALEDLGTWYPLHEDSIVITDQKKIFIPFVKGVKIIGKVVIDREKYSSEFEKIMDLSRIKVTAVDSAGKEYSGLTNPKGEFEIFAPYGKYTLRMDESICGDRFKLIKNNYMVELKQGVDGIFHTFYIVERKRKLAKKKFGADGKLIETSTDDTSGGGADKKQLKSDDLNNEGNKQGANENNKTGNNNVPENNGTDTTKQKDNKASKDLIDQYTPEQRQKMRDDFVKTTITSSSIKGIVFTVQLGAFALPIKPDAFAKIPFPLVSEVLPNGMVRVSSGQFKTYTEAKAYQKECAELGFTEDYVVGYKDGVYLSPNQAKKLK